MEIAGILERAERICQARQGAADIGALSAALVAEREFRAWLDASQAQLAAKIAATASFPEQTIAASSKGSLSQASAVMERAATLESTPSIAAPLDRGAVTAGHVDAISRTGRTLEPAQRERLLDRVDTLVGVAEHASQAEFARRVRDEARRVQAADGMDVLAWTRRPRR